MKFYILFFYIMIIFLSTNCKNVVLKNTKTNTVRVAKLEQLFELGDTIMFENAKYEIIRKKLRNGDIVKKEPIIRPSKTSVPAPSKKP